MKWRPVSEPSPLLTQEEQLSHTLASGNGQPGFILIQKIEALHSQPASFVSSFTLGQDFGPLYPSSSHQDPTSTACSHLVYHLDHWQSSAPPWPSLVHCPPPSEYRFPQDPPSETDVAGNAQDAEMSTWHSMGQRTSGETYQSARNLFMIVLQISWGYPQEPCTSLGLDVTFGIYNC